LTILSQRVPGLAWALPVPLRVESWLALQQLERWQPERQQQERQQRVPGLAWALPVPLRVEFWLAPQQLERWQPEQPQLER
jgi:hypothetical protein